MFNIMRRRAIESKGFLGHSPHNSMLPQGEVFLDCELRKLLQKKGLSPDLHKEN